jgi:hypothetical protein
MEQSMGMVVEDAGGCKHTELHVYVRTRIPLLLTLTSPTLRHRISRAAQDSGVLAIPFGGGAYEAGLAGHFGSARRFWGAQS